MELIDESSVLLADRLALLVDAVEEYGIFMLDPNGCVVTWNTGAQRIKGYSAGEILGQHFSRFYTPEDVTSGKPAMELEAALRYGRYCEEGWRVRKDGSRFWANVLITAIYDGRGHHEGFAKVTRDDTDRLVAAQRDHQLELLAERDRISMEMTSTVVHRIFSAGLILHGALSVTSEESVATRIEEAIAELDGTVRQIRAVVVDLEPPGGT